MLISFSVANFRSIGTEQTLNLVASNKITDHPEHLVSIPATQNKVLRTAVMYGANAAGKSNLVRAMSFAQSIIANDGRPIPAEPFRFSDEFARKPSSFEFRFLTRDRVFIYGFDIYQRDIQSEWLYVIQGDAERRIFERDPQGVVTAESDFSSLFPNDHVIQRTLAAFGSAPLVRQQLFLNRLKSLPEDSQGETLRAIVRWLMRELAVLLPDHQSSDILDRLADKEFRDLAGGFLYSVGTGVSTLEIEEEEIPADNRNRPAGQIFAYRWGRGLLGDLRPKPDDPTRYIARKLLAVHPVGSLLPQLPFSEESDGTQQLLHFMPVLASVTQDAKVFVIDELDRSLHPLICWEFIRLFSETLPGTRKQLIVTTHEAHLLDQELLRRDEYWFVEKDSDQQTRLVSLSEFNVRNDLHLEKGYLHGRFGAIPIMGQMAELEALLAKDES